jgi:predicted MFS family arabinose efflux permease
MEDSRQSNPEVNSGIGHFKKAACLFTVTFLFAMACGVTNLGMIFFAKNVLGATPGQVGILASSWSVFYVVGCLFTRRWAAAMPPRFSIVMAAFTAFFSVMMIYLLKSLVWSFIFYALYGLALAMFWPVVMGWISAGLEDKRLSRVMGWFNLSWSAASIISPVIAGWLEDTGDSFAVRGGSGIFITAALFMCAAIFLVPELGRGVEVARPSPAAAKAQDARGTPLRYPSWLSVFASFFLAGSITTVVSLAAGTDLDISKKMVGIILFARSLVMSLTLLFMGQTAWWHFRGRQISVGVLIGLLAAVMLAFTRSPGAIILIMVMVGVFAAQSYTNSLFHGVSGVADKTWRMAVHEMILNAGAIFGSAAGGMAYGAAGLSFTYLFCAGVLAIIFILTGIFLGAMRRRERIDGQVGLSL